MKIILKAFGKLKSEPIDVPENTTSNFDLVLTQPIQCFSTRQGEDIPLMDKDLIKRCRFEWVGKYENDCRIYQLTEI
jgi:hypothetical protein